MKNFFANLDACFRLDVRALALGRVALGVVLGFDFAERLALVPAFYAQGGLAPAQCSLISVFCWGGHPLWIYALFAIYGSALLAFTVGLASQPTALVVFLLKVALHAKQPALQNGGDLVAVLSAFHLAFLPCGAVWSIDAWRARRRGAPPPPLQHRSIASFAYVVQIASVYGFAAVLKDPSVWLFDATAVRDAFSITTYARPFADRLLSEPTLLAIASRVTVLFELAACVLLVTWPGRIGRAMVLTGLMAMHVMMGATLAIIWFAPICIAALLPLLPLSTGEAPRTTLRLERFLAFVVAVTFVQNVASLPALRWLDSQLAGVTYVTGLRQSWRMFAPRPTQAHGFVTVTGTMEDGSARDLLRGERGALDDNWRRYFFIRDKRPGAAQWGDVGAYFCRRDGFGAAVSARRLVVQYVAYRTEPDGTVSGPVVTTLLERDCAQP